MLAGQTSTGGSVSLTVTVKVQVLALPATSVAVQVTGVVTVPKLESVGGLQATIWELSPGAALLTMLPGQTSTGGSVSLTVTLKVQVLVLPAASVAVQAT